MSSPEMNVRALKKMSRPITILGASIVACGLSGCGGAFDPTVDSQSPVAPRVVALVEANRTFPRWTDFPTAEPAPQPAVIAAGVNTLHTEGEALARQAERLEWTLDDPVKFQNDVAARINATQASPAAIETTAEIEARAAALRARAAAPPPIDRPK